MSTARLLMIVSEALAGGALICSFVIPKDLDFGFRVSSQMSIGSVQQLKQVVPSPAGPWSQVERFQARAFRPP